MHLIGCGFMTNSLTFSPPPSLLPLPHFSPPLSLLSPSLTSLPLPHFSPPPSPDDITPLNFTTVFVSTSDVIVTWSLSPLNVFTADPFPVQLTSFTLCFHVMLPHWVSVWSSPPSLTSISGCNWQFDWSEHW